jgi:hypothetical protein
MGQHAGMPSTPELRAAGRLPSRFIGGANVPAWGMRANGTWPLGRLEIDEASLCLSLRPKWIGAIDLRATRLTVKEAFRVERRFGLSGVGFQLGDGREGYFWTTRSAEILARLAALGYSVTGSRRRTKVWTATP